MPFASHERVRYEGQDLGEDGPRALELGTVVDVNPFEGSLVVSWDAAGTTVHGWPVTNVAAVADDRRE